jgi:outer membrane protein insertion porin family
MHKQLAVFLIFFIVCCGQVFHLSAQENYEVRRVSFHGNKTLDEDFLLEGMALKEVSYLEKIITSQIPFLFNRELVNKDMERLTRIYQSEGFLNAKTKLQPLKVNDKKQVVKIDIEVEEGDPVLVGHVSVEMKETADSFNIDSLSKRVFRKMELTEGRRFRDVSLAHDMQLVKDAFRDMGHAYVEVSYGLQLKPDSFKTGISYFVSPGPVSYFGETSISGNKHVSETFIRKQIQYEENELYNKSLLNETRRVLYQLQLFRIVSVLPQTDAGTRKSPIPVKIYIEEAPRLSTRFGVGYGTEDKFRTFLDLNYLGFLGSARRINLYLKHSSLEPYSISLRWIQPRFFDKNSSIAINPFLIRNKEPGYDTRTFGLNVPVNYRFNNRLNSTLTYYLEDVEQTIEEGDMEFPDMESEKFPYNKSGILLGTVFNNSSPQFTPEKGVNLALGFKLNGHLFGGSFNYTKFWGDFRTYHEIGNMVLAFRAMAGGINSTDSSQFIPVEDRFYSGGSNSVRGWNRSELGPKRESGTPLGGKSIVESSVEIRYPLFWRLSGVTFLDAGNVWEQSYQYQLGKLAYAAGAGLRMETPIGPIRLDLGFPIWNEKKSPQLFISVGQAF